MGSPPREHPPSAERRRSQDRAEEKVTTLPIMGDDMPENTVAYIIVWYVVYALPFAVISSKGKGRAKYGFLIALIPALVSTYASLIRPNAEPAPLLMDTPPALPLIFFMVGWCASWVALHYQWQGRYPRLGYPGGDSHGLAIVIVTLPVLGPIFAIPWAFILAHSE